MVNREDYAFCNNTPCCKVDITGLDSRRIGEIESLDLKAHAETNGPKGQSSVHIHIGNNKYDYRNDRELPGFYDRKTGKPLPHSIRKQLRKIEEWKRIMEKAERIVKENGGLSPKFGGGKVIKGCVSIVTVLESANMLNNYVDAMKSGDIKQMNRVFRNFLGNLPDCGTIARSCIFEDAYKFHNEMKLFVSKNRKKD